MYIVHERCERGQHLINWSTSAAEDTVGKVRPLVTRVGGVMARLGGQGGPSSVIICMQPPSVCTTQNSTNNQKTNIPEVRPSRSSFDIFCTFTFTNTLTLGINNFSFKFRFASRWGLEDNWTRESNDPSSKSPLSRKNILSKSTGLRSKLWSNYYAVVVLYRFQGLSESSLTILFTPRLLILRGTSYSSSRLLLALPIPRPFYF